MCFVTKLHPSIIKVASAIYRMEENIDGLQLWWIHYKNTPGKFYESMNIIVIQVNSEKLFEFL